VPWTQPKLKELVERASEDLSIRLLDGNALEPRGVLSTIATMRGGGEYLMYAFLSWAAEQIFPDKAELEFLNDWGKVWGVIRKPAVAAKGEVTVTGAPGASIAGDTLAKDQRGRQYRLAGVILPTDGGTEATDVCEVEAVEPGEAGNLPAGTKINLISPSAGIKSELTVGPQAMEGGADEESDANFRKRVLLTIQTPPHGGNKADYEMWALESVAAVENALCIPTYSGVGSVAVAIWGKPEAPVLAEVTVQAAYDYILARAPVTAGPGLRVYTPATMPVDFTIKLIPDTVETRKSVQKELWDIFAAEGQPGVMIPLTHLAEAVSRAAGEYDHEMVAPAQNITPDLALLPVMGEITWVE
jgi:uncharacterized phage protein gp47/JayE